MYPNENENLIVFALIGYNNSIHNVTKFTPFELTFGHTSARNPNEIFTPETFYLKYAENYKNKIDHVYRQVKDILVKSKENITEKNTFDNQNNEFRLEQTVYKRNPKGRNKKFNKFLGPYIVTKILGRNRLGRNSTY